MKFVLKILSFLPHNWLQYLKPKVWFSSLSNMLILATVSLLFCSFIMLLSLLIGGSGKNSKDAAEIAQHLEISLADSKITGKILSTDINSKETKATETKSTETKSTENKSSDTKENSDKAADSSDKSVEQDKTKEASTDSGTEQDKSHSVAEADDSQQQASTDVENAESDKQKSELAWLKEDFTGPKLPEEIVEALFGSEIKTKVKVDTVSIKDISDKPLVVVIIKGMGLSTSSTLEAFELPKEVTFGFSPYSPKLEEWVKKSKAASHEVVLNIPMETNDYRTDNPGPYSLLLQSSVDDNLTRLKMLLGLVKDYSAIYSDSTETFTHSAVAIKPVLEMLQKEGKYFVYGGGYANYSLIQVADSLSYPILVNDVVLDEDIAASAINEQFELAEKTAKEKGFAVIMARPYPISVRMLKSWLSKTEEKGIVIRPVSVLLGKAFK